MSVYISYPFHESNCINPSNKFCCINMSDISYLAKSGVMYLFFILKKIKR